MRAQARDGAVVMQTANPTQALLELTQWAVQRGTVLAGLTVNRPTLEDTYLQLTSKGASADTLEGTTR